MPAGPVGSVWVAGSWLDTVWLEDSWGDAGTVILATPDYIVRIPADDVVVLIPVDSVSVTT